MTADTPAPISTAQVPAVIALNNVHAVELSWLERDRFDKMLAQAFYARVIGEADAVLVAFDQTAAYDSPNYLWFRARYPRFIYIDRIVVADAARGRGLARRLYADLFAQSLVAGHELIVCEVNIDPPNPASDAFHAALGFAEVGQDVIHNVVRGGKKTVRYLALRLKP